MAGELLEPESLTRLTLEPGVGPEALAGSCHADHDVPLEPMGGVPRLEDGGTHEAGVAAGAQDSDHHSSSTGGQDGGRSDHEVFELLPRQMAPSPVSGHVRPPQGLYQ